MFTELSSDKCLRLAFKNPPIARFARVVYETQYYGESKARAVSLQISQQPTEKAEPFQLTDSCTAKEIGFRIQKHFFYRSIYILVERSARLIYN